MNPSPQTKNVIDREASLRRLGGDEKLLATMAGFFLEDAPVLMSQLNSALSARDFEIVTHRAHSLKGLSATFDAIPFKTLAQEIEMLSKAENEPALKERVSELTREFDRLVACLRDLVQSATPVH